MTTIRGSAAGTIPWHVNKILREHTDADPNCELTFGEIFALCPKEFSRGAVSFALNGLTAKGVVKTSGKRRTLLYSLTGLALPERVPKDPYWKKPKALTIVKPPAVEKIPKPKGKPGPKTAESHFDGNEFLTVSKFRTPREPERVCCQSCEWYGPEKGCPDCKYIFPNERIAA